MSFRKEQKLQVVEKTCRGKYVDIRGMKWAV
jgi:hypothetical protein